MHGTSSSSGARVQITALCSPPRDHEDDGNNNSSNADSSNATITAQSLPQRGVRSNSTSARQSTTLTTSQLHAVVVDNHESERNGNHSHCDNSSSTQPRMTVTPADPPTRAPLGPLRLRKRSTRMSNSTRGKLYRSRRKKYTDGLTEYVEGLRQEVEDLQLYRGTQRASLYHSRHLSTSSPFARTVCEYFSLFEFGVPVVAAASGLDSVPRDALVRSSRQASFLNSMVAPNFLFSGMRGVHLLLEQWERYSVYHLQLQFQLHRLEVVVADVTNAVMVAKATLRVRFSRFTIEKVFPHVLWNESLLRRLVGLEVLYPVNCTFYFDSDGQITQFDPEVDFISAFTSALGSLRDAIELVGHALIKEQHMFVEEGERIDVMQT